MGEATRPISEGYLRSVADLERRLGLVETRWVRLAGNPVILDSRVLTASAASITFSGINQNFSHLQINCYMRGNAAPAGVQSRLRLNGDAGANYDAVTIWANGGTAAATVNLALTFAYAGAVPTAGAVANQFGTSQMSINYYAGTTRKNIMTNWAYRADAVGGMLTGQTSAFWSTTAVTSVSLFPETDSYVAGSKFTLIGIP